jgi:glutamate decarboxylase
LRAFSLNFSKGAAQVVAQYYNFLRLGKEGYRDVMLRLYEVGEHLNNGIAAIPQFEILGNGPGLPLVCFRLRPGPKYTVFELSAKLRERGWIVPAYTLAPDAEGISVLRVVVREGFSRDMADNLLEDLKRTIAYLQTVHPVHHNRPRKAKTAGIC